MRRDGAFRRKQFYRKRKRAERIVAAWAWHNALGWEPYSASFTAVMAITPQRCSCMGCGNQRRYEGPTVQERRQWAEFQEQVKEVGRVLIMEGQP